MANINPLVSIIILAYKPSNFTLQCLRSIEENVKDIAYEVVIPDAPADVFKELKKQAVHSPYLFFLMNDTLVRKDGLKHLVDIMEKDAAVGMVGPKLIRPDRTLYQAGGVVWRDGSTIHYGQGDDPDKSEYNYVKEVDFISGAGFMIRSELWGKTGGFDGRYASLTYEDADLAFQVRKHGFKVMYQPKSVIEYYGAAANANVIEKKAEKPHGKQ